MANPCDCPFCDPIRAPQIDPGRLAELLRDGVMPVIPVPFVWDFHSEDNVDG